MTTQLKVLLSGLVLMVAGCSEAPTHSNTEPIEEYVVITNAGMYDFALRYSLSDGSIDTLHYGMSVFPRRSAISYQYNEIYIAASLGDNDERVLIYDLDSLAYKGEMAQSAVWGLFPSPDEQLLALTWNDLRIVRRNGYEVIFEDTLLRAYWPACWSEDGSSFYCHVWDTDYGPTGIYKVDLSAPPISPEHIWTGFAVDFRVSSDESVLFILNHENNDSKFQVYDLRNDAVLYEYDLEETFDGSSQYNPYGEIELSPDGHSVIAAVSLYGGVGPDWITASHATGRIHEFDTRSFSHEAAIELAAAPVDSLVAPLDAFAMTTSRRGDRLIILGSGNSLGTYLFDYNLAAKTYERVTLISFDRAGWQLSR